MHTPLIYEKLARLRCAEWQERSLHNQQIADLVATTRRTAHGATGPVPLPRRLALRFAWRLARLASGPTGTYTVQGPATLVDACGNALIVDPGEAYLVLLPEGR